jgi:hypothetical protein
MKIGAKFKGSYRRRHLTRAMTEYFKPLMSWLEEQNQGRQIGCE